MEQEKLPMLIGLLLVIVVYIIYKYKTDKKYKDTFFDR